MPVLEIEMVPARLNQPVSTTPTLSDSLATAAASDPATNMDPPGRHRLKLRSLNKHINHIIFSLMMSHNIIKYGLWQLLSQGHTIENWILLGLDGAWGLLMLVMVITAVGRRGFASCSIYAGAILMIAILTFLKQGTFTPDAVPFIFDGGMILGGVVSGCRSSPWPVTIRVQPILYGPVQYVGAHFPPQQTSPPGPHAVHEFQPQPLSTQEQSRPSSAASEVGDAASDFSIQITDDGVSFTET